ncbi:WD repeat-containing protein 31 isoform X2 [Narcine bancroftii]|uniref:WD repeat-containing protein 31 isoform X2 n=1 Tax=Narcine bancroftii TaxID=1343680 RepID=UPI0038320748
MAPLPQGPLLTLHRYTVPSPELTFAWIDGYAAHSSSTQTVQQYNPVHNDAVTSLASLTSEQCVSGGKDKTVVVYNWKSGGMQQKFVGHERDVTKVTCIFRSNKIFSASRDKTALMWDVDSKAGPLQEFTGHDLGVTGLAVSPGGLQLCTGSRDNSLCMWDVETGICLQKYSISRNLLWDLRQAKRNVCEYKGHLQSTAACIFLPSETSSFPMVATSAYDCTVRIWNRDTADCISSLCLDGAGPLTSLVCSDGTSLLCGSFNTGIHHLQLSYSNGCSLSEVARF